MLKDKNKLAYGFFLLFVAAFILIVLRGLKTAQPGDENVYYYMGRLISEGKIPYKDFFYAHPPLHIYLIAFIYKIFGFNIVVFKFLPMLATMMSAFFVFKIAKEKFGSTEAIIASLLFIFSYGVMFNSVFSFGVDVATMFLAIGFYLLWNKNNYVLAGVLFGLAGVTRLLALVPIAIILVSTLLSNKKHFIKLSSAFLTIFLLVNGIFALLFGAQYLTPVYKYHTLKSFGYKENFKEYLDIIKLNWILFSSAFLLVFVKDKESIKFPLVISISYLIFLAALNKLFGFYFVVVFPFLAVIGSYNVAGIFRNPNLSKKLLVPVSVILLLVFFWNLLSDLMFLQKIGFSGFERGRDLADFIDSNSDKDTLLFGDDSVVPLLALMTGRKIASDFVDTNNQIFISGVKNLNEVLGSLKGKDTLFIVRSAQGLSYFDEVKSLLSKNCEFLSQFHDKTEGDYLVYRCG